MGRVATEGGTWLPGPQCRATCAELGRCESPSTRGQCLCYCEGGRCTSHRARCCAAAGCHAGSGERHTGSTTRFGAAELGGQPYTSGPPCQCREPYQRWRRCSAPWSCTQHGPCARVAGHQHLGGGIDSLPSADRCLARGTRGTDIGLGTAWCSCCPPSHKHNLEAAVPKAC